MTFAPFISEILIFTASHWYYINEVFITQRVHLCDNICIIFFNIHSASFDLIWVILVICELFKWNINNLEKIHFSGALLIMQVSTSTWLIELNVSITKIIPFMNKTNSIWNYVSYQISHKQTAGGCIFIVTFYFGISTKNSISNDGHISSLPCHYSW